MGEQLSVDTDRLNVAVPGITQLSSLVGGIFAGLNDTLDALGECWGGNDDPTGRAFAAQYEQPKQTLLIGMQSTQSALDSTAEGVTTMVKGFTETESQNTQTARSLGAPEEGAGTRP